MVSMMTQYQFFNNKEGEKSDASDSVFLSSNLTINYVLSNFITFSLLVIKYYFDSEIPTKPH